MVESIGGMWRESRVIRKEPNSGGRGKKRTGGKDRGGLLFETTDRSFDDRDGEEIGRGNFSHCNDNREKKLQRPETVIIVNNVPSYLPAAKSGTKGSF
jgi:hypothetical protein